MFDGPHRDAHFDAAGDTSSGQSGHDVLATDPVALLRELEIRLAQSEEVVQREVSRLHARLSKLERDVDSVTGAGPADVRALEREIMALSDRLAKLEAGDR